MYNIYLEYDRYVLKFYNMSCNIIGKNSIYTYFIHLIRGDSDQYILC